MLLGLEASQLKLPESLQCLFPPFFMSFLWPCGLLLGKGLTVEVLRVMDLLPFLLGESCVCAQVGVCVYVHVCLRAEGMEHTEPQALRERERMEPRTEKAWGPGSGREEGSGGSRPIFIISQSLGCEVGVFSL